MYKNKYYKYKQKYLLLKGGGADFGTPEDEPDVVNYDDIPDLNPIENELDTMVDLGQEEEEIREMFAEYPNEYEGFNEALSDNLQQIVVDVGLFGLARAKRYTIDDFDNSFFIDINSKPDKTKILRIDNIDDFDKFTEQYGKLDSKNNNNNIYIKWDDIASKYRGFYLTSASLQNRDQQIPYKNITVNNWVNTEPIWNTGEYNFIDEVLLFVKELPSIYLNKIYWPFRGMIAEEYAINEKDFVSIYDKITYDKVLFIHNVESFDKFTNKYGFVKTKYFDKYDKYVKFIDINWNRVSIDYIGFYIDKDNDFREDRYRYAFLEDEKYRSWWKANKIDEGLVYLFE